MRESRLPKFCAAPVRQPTPPPPPPPKEPTPPPPKEPTPEPQAEPEPTAEEPTVEEPAPPAEPEPEAAPAEATPEESEAPAAAEAEQGASGKETADTLHLDIQNNAIRSIFQKRTRLHRNRNQRSKPSPVRCYGIAT